MPTKYGLSWSEGWSPARIEMKMIQSGGYIVQDNQKVGEGLFHHYRELQKLLWPEDDHHRWSDQILSEWLNNRITVVMGCRDSSKTRTVSKAALIDYYCFPNETLTLMTSTNIRGLELRVWGDIKSLHERAQDICSWLPGNISDSKHGIFTDKITDGEGVRDMRRGILGVPMLGSQGEYTGNALKDFAGIKQKRRRLVGDELQFIPVEYLKVLDSLDKGDFKAGFLGNPIADNGKALDRVSEPVEGWDSLGDYAQTRTWKNKYGGTTISLVGTDSPNFDAATRNRYPYMIDEADAERVSKRPGGKDSIEWWSQIVGIRKAGAVINRVLTVAEIERHDGLREPVWSGEDRIKVYAIDAGFGGDDCVRTWLEFGTLTDGKRVLCFGDQKIIPIGLSSSLSPEKQIARYAKEDCALLGIPASNLFFDAGMYATLAVELAREMTPEVNAVNFGGPATQRAVDNSTFVFDQKNQMRRLKTWYEHVSKFVTELWFATRLLVHCRQARRFPHRAAEEFGRREWNYVAGDRYELETKEDYKLRNGGESPNHADSLVIGVEGARRLGFTIEAIPEGEALKPENSDYLEREARRYWRLKSSLHAYR